VFIWAHVDSDDTGHSAAKLFCSGIGASLERLRYATHDHFPAGRLIQQTKVNGEHGRMLALDGFLTKFDSTFSGIPCHTVRKRICDCVYFVLMLRQSGSLCTSVLLWKTSDMATQ
jgi:hypothetical protein